MTEIRDLIANGINHSLSQISSEIFHLQESLSYLKKIYGEEKFNDELGKVSVGQKADLKAKLCTVEKELEKLKLLVKGHCP